MGDCSFSTYSLRDLEVNLGVRFPAGAEGLASAGCYFAPVSPQLAVVLGTLKLWAEDEERLLGVRQWVNGKAGLRRAAEAGQDFQRLRDLLALDRGTLEKEALELANDLGGYVNLSRLPKDWWQREDFRRDVETTALASALGVTVAWLDDQWRVRYTVPAQNPQAEKHLVCLQLCEQFTLCLSLRAHASSLSACLQLILRKTEQVALLEVPSEASAEVLKVLKRVVGSAAHYLSRTSLVTKTDLRTRHISAGFCSHQATDIQLECRHWICWCCIGPWTPDHPSHCYCGYALSLREVRQVLTEADFEESLKRAQSQGVDFCIHCQRIVPYTLIADCRHNFCSACVLTAIYSQTQLCPLCETYGSRKLIHQLQALYCEACRSLKQAQAFPPVSCQHRLYCFACYRSPQQCPCNSHDLSPEEAAAVQKAFFTCCFCSTQVNRTLLFRGSACLCLMCAPCTLTRLAVSGDRCPVCGEPLKQQAWAEVAPEVRRLQQEAKAAQPQEEEKQSPAQEPHSSRSKRKRGRRRGK